MTLQTGGLSNALSTLAPPVCPPLYCPKCLLPTAFSTFKNLENVFFRCASPPGFAHLRSAWLGKPAYSYQVPRHGNSTQRVTTNRFSFLPCPESFSLRSPAPPRHRMLINGCTSTLQIAPQRAKKRPHAAKKQKLRNEPEKSRQLTHNKSLLRKKTNLPNFTPRANSP